MNVFGGNGNGSVMNSGSTYVGYSSFTSNHGGALDVNGSFQTQGDLVVGNHANVGTVGVGGLLTVGGTTTINADSSIQMGDGGRIDFGSIDADSYSRIFGNGGQLAGLLNTSGYQHLDSLSYSNTANLDVSEVRAMNTGVIHGSGTTRIGLANQSTGEVRTLGGQWARFSGIGNTNAGEINNFVGVIEFENDLTNQVGGFIGGRGQFITGTGLTNDGEMAFSGGNADILGTVNNVGVGTIITSGYSITTFFDDVVHNGEEIRTQEGSATVFLGAISGAGAFTGTGDVFMEGDINIGNSPDVVTVEGNLNFGARSSSLFEIAGTEYGEFDKFMIGGDFSINGMFHVELLDDFLLGYNQEYLIAEVAGLTSGQFMGLGEGGLVGRFGGHDLFISYTRGDGNDVGLFTAVPEPGSTLFLGLVGSVLLYRRRRAALRDGV